MMLPLTADHTGSGNAKKSPGAHTARDMERKKSPSHWYNGVAEDGGHDNQSRSHHRRYVDTSYALPWQHCIVDMSLKMTC